MDVTRRLTITKTEEKMNYNTLGKSNWKKEMIFIIATIKEIKMDDQDKSRQNV